MGLDADLMLKFHIQLEDKINQLGKRDCCELGYILVEQLKDTEAGLKQGNICKL